MRSIQPLVLLAAAVACSSCDKSHKPALDGAAEPSFVRVDMPPASDIQRLASSSNAFAFDLWHKIGTRQGNLAVSPISISAALTMTWGGARGETEQQMRKVLHLQGGDQDKTGATFGQLSRALQNPARALKLRIANRLFGEQSFKFEQPYLDKTRNWYGAPLEPVDFAASPDPSRQRINAWVEQQTEHRIKDLLPALTITNDTRMVLVNAIYFLADWATPFKKELTSEQPFHVSPASAKNVQTMHLMTNLRWAGADGVSVLEMPYQGDDAAMLLVLPDAVDGLADVEKSITLAKLDTWRAALTTQNVSVSLPRFEVNPQDAIALRPALVSLGMPLVFDPAAADFTSIGIPPDPRYRLYISEAFHKAFVKVDEKGTEAAAATALIMAAGASAPAKIVEFRADHPFLFFIVDKPSGLILFMGRVEDPSAHG